MARSFTSQVYRAARVSATGAGGQDRQRGSAGQERGGRAGHVACVEAAMAVTPGQGGSLPHTVGLCPDPSHAGEFYMPDPSPGDNCPYCPNQLVVYASERHFTAIPSDAREGEPVPLADS